MKSLDRDSSESLKIVFNNHCVLNTIVVVKDEIANGRALLHSDFKPAFGDGRSYLGPGNGSARGEIWLHRGLRLVSDSIRIEFKHHKPITMREPMHDDNTYF